LMKTLPEPIQASLAASIPFPSRLGKPEEFAQLASHIVSNTHLNGEVIRLKSSAWMVRCVWPLAERDKTNDQNRCLRS
jgi:hypothetical protein